MCSRTGSGVGAWTTSPTTPPFAAGACPSPTLCVTVYGQQIQPTTDPAAATWTKQAVTDHLDDVTRPSSSLCLAVGQSGALDISTNPASGGWTPSTIDNGYTLVAISCPSTSLCVAVDANGHVVTSTDPTGGPSAWTPALINGEPLHRYNALQRRADRPLRRNRPAHRRLEHDPRKRTVPDRAYPDRRRPCLEPQRNTAKRPAHALTPQHVGARGTEPAMAASPTRLNRSLDQRPHTTRRVHLDDPLSLIADRRNLDPQPADHPT
jgi:hypothetical protein